MFKIKTAALATTVAALVCLVGAAPARAAAVFDAEGPVTMLETTPELRCNADIGILWPEAETLETAACGTFATVNGGLYAPTDAPRGGLLPDAAGTWTPVSQTSTGDGTYYNPFIITTVVTGGGLELTQTDKYGRGASSFKTTIQVRNTSDSPLETVVYRAADCSVSADWSFAETSTGDGSVACRSADGEVTGPSGAGLTRGTHLTQLIPLTPGSEFASGPIRQVWGSINAGADLNDATADPNTPLDQGLALSWRLNVTPGETRTIESQTHFSLKGTRALPTRIDAAPTFDGKSRVTITFGTDAEPGPLPVGIAVWLPEGASYVEGSSTTGEGEVYYEEELLFLPPADSTATSISFELEAGEGGVDGKLEEPC